MAERKGGLKSLLMKMRVKTTGLKLSIQKAKIMASRPITSWQIDRETMETVKMNSPLFSWAPKSLQMVIAAMTLKGACCLEEKL